MDENAREISLMLDAVAKALAEWTVSRQAELDPTLAERYGGRWRSDWVGDTRMRVRHLAQAVAVRRPRLFAETAQWTATAHRARELRPDDLRTNLHCLREVLSAELPAEARDAVGPCLEQALTRIDTPAGGGNAVPGEAASHSERVLEYLEAVLSGDRGGAERMILEAADGGASVTEIHREILIPAQREVGRMWHVGEITVADEHLATAATEGVMARLRAHFPAADAGGRCVLATAVAGDLHSIGVRMVADQFEMSGWKVFCLGANTPDADVVRGLIDHDADLLAISASGFLHLRAVGDLIAAVRRVDGLRRLPVIVGGSAFNLIPDLWQELGADGSAPDAETAVRLGDRLVTRGTEAG